MHSRRADSFIRDQGRTIAASLQQWERDAVLAGARLPVLSKAFTVAVVQAADNDWLALGNDSPHPAGSHRHHRAWALVRQGLSLVVPLAAATGIFLAVHPLPDTLVPLLTFLVGIAVARILRWLDLGDDIDPGIKITELLRQPQ